MKISTRHNAIYYLERFLPNEFEIKDLGKDFLKKVGISQSTLERRLKEMVELGFLTKLGHGHYKKTDKCPTK